VTHRYIKNNLVTSIHPKCYYTGLVVLIEKHLWKWPWRCQRISFIVLALLHACKYNKPSWSHCPSLSRLETYSQKPFNCKMSPARLNLTPHCQEPYALQLLRTLRGFSVFSKKRNSCQPTKPKCHYGSHIKVSQYSCKTKPWSINH